MIPVRLLSFSWDATPLQALIILVLALFLVVLSIGGPRGHHHDADDPLADSHGIVWAHNWIGVALGLVPIIVFMVMLYALIHAAWPKA